MNSGGAEALLTKGLSRIRVPQPTDRVYKDECVFSFDTPETDTGLYICLSTFWGMGKDYVEGHSARTGNSIYLHIHRIKRKIPIPQATEGPEKKVTRFAIGVEGGFDTGSPTHEYEITETHSVYILPGFVKIDLPNDKLPQQLLGSVQGVLKAESATKLAELETMAATWDGEVRKVSRFAADLAQLDNDKKIPPQGWRCEIEGCGLTENLWLNLTDGAIRCGRRYADGSGGNNHAVEYYNTMRYPLAVKLGTITSDGRADVYSYDEDDMVEDPYLVKHLAHFGINVAVMEKTDKSMAEMEIDINQRFGEWLALQETGGKLRPLRGPGLTGLINLGNTCYLNSIMQVLISIPEFQNRFQKNAAKYFESSNDPVNDLNVQMSKLVLGLLSGKYSRKVDSEEETDTQVGISPSMFRTLVGKGHPEFSTKKQQDAQEFFLHLINVLERASRNEPSPADCFKFQVEDKIVCDATSMVRYSSRVEYCLPLPIPLEAALNKVEYDAFIKRQGEAEAAGIIIPAEERVRPKIPVDACLGTFIEKETLDMFLSSATREIGTASKYTRLATFPNYLVIQLKKFMMGNDWQPKKLDVLVDMPLELDITALRAKGLQPGEIELPRTEDPKKAQAPPINENTVTVLMEMGFNPNACRRAVVSTGNAEAEIAMNWLMEHMDDPDINDPINCDVGQNFVVNEANLHTIQSMGFTAEQALKALRATDNNVERAMEWIFSHPDELNNPSPSPTNSDTTNNADCGSQIRSQASGVTDGHGLYKLLGFVSHMGTSSQVGHYVCHIHKEDGWAIFNDNKVAASENLPKDLGYLYFYKRV